jgi:hypothetical protein
MASLTCSGQARPKYLSPAKRGEIIAALRANPHAGDVAKQLRVHYAKVWRVAKAEGIELSAGHAAKGRRGLSPDRRAAIVTMLKATPHANTVARQLGDVSETTVRTIGQAAGVDFSVGRQKKPR